jgi:hypothetical protein
LKCRPDELYDALIQEQFLTAQGNASRCQEVFNLLREKMHEQFLLYEELSFSKAYTQRTLNILKLFSQSFNNRNGKKIFYLLIDGQDGRMVPSPGATGEKGRSQRSIRPRHPSHLLH